MNKIIVASAIVFSLSTGVIFCSEEKMQRIMLRDRSVIIGKVVEMKDDVYTIRTDSMGEFKIGADRILEISAADFRKKADVAAPTEFVEPATDKNPAPEIKIMDGARKKSEAAAAPEGSFGSVSDDMTNQQQQINSRVRSMTMNEDFLESVMNLGDNQALMDIMGDGEIMDAISRSDYDFLMNNEKMKTLMDSEEIKSILGDVQP